MSHLCSPQPITKAIVASHLLCQVSALLPAIVESGFFLHCIKVVRHSAIAHGGDSGFIGIDRGRPCDVVESS